MTRGSKIGMIVGICCGIVGIAAWIIFGVAPLIRSNAPLEPARSTMGTSGGYVIIATEKADNDYTQAIAIAKEIHPEADKMVFSPASLEVVKSKLKKLQPRYALLFMTPDEIDANFVWKWLKMASEIDDDPFVDFCYGFITGRNAKAAAAFMERIKDAAEGKLKLAGKMIDNLGSNMQAKASAFYQNRGSYMIPVFSERCSLETISHGRRGFTKERLSSMYGAGIVHWGGHGYPDRVVDSLNGPFVQKLKLSPCIAFNGACYTGVTSTWFSMMGGKLKKQKVDDSKSFCLGILTNNVIAYLAALHADHGIPVYQEMEYMATTGASLGEIIKHTYDGVVLGNGGKLPHFGTLTEGMILNWSPKDIMLNGTATRVLFGDPAYVPIKAFSSKPFDIKTSIKDGELEIVATLVNPVLKSTYTDTYHSDMSITQQFNDRALLFFGLPNGWDTVKKVSISDVTVNDKLIKHKLVGYAVERDGKVSMLHIQIDLPSSGYMQSPFRKKGARIKLRAKR